VLKWFAKHTPFFNAYDTRVYEIAPGSCNPTVKADVAHKFGVPLVSCVVWTINKQRIQEEAT